MIDNEEDQQNIVSFGFTDVLIGFLISTFLLMIIVKYGFNAGGEVAGLPKNYFIYKAKIEAKGNSHLSIDNAIFQVIIITPQGERIESLINRNGNKYNKKGFIEFKNKNFYGIGPSRKKGDSKSRFFTIYGAMDATKSEVLEIGIRYVHNKELTPKNRDENLSVIQKVANHGFLVNHNLRHSFLKENDPDLTENPEKLNLGDDCTMKVLISVPKIN